MHNTASRTLLITVPIGSELRERLLQTFPDMPLEIYDYRDGDTIPDDVWRNVEILYTLNSLPPLEKAPNLRWVQLYSAGADQAFAHPIIHTPITITTTSGVHAVAIAEFVLMMQLAWFHHLPLVMEWQQKGKWAPRDVWRSMFTVEELRGKTIGIVGYGSIGREVARLAKAFGMRVLAQQHSDDHRDRGFIFPGVGDPDGTIPDAYYPPAQLHSLLRESDVVVLAVPLTPQTTNLFDEAAFQAMKSTALLVNIARGAVCNEQALIQALREQRIAGAALDVLNQEPLPDGHPLWQLPNVIISPHISGGSNRYGERAFAIFTENLRRYLAGEPLYNVVNREQGY